jgi:hypothetical protein
MATSVSRGYRMGRIHANCSNMADTITIFNIVNGKNKGKQMKALHAHVGRMQYTPLTCASSGLNMDYK